MKEILLKSRQKECFQPGACVKGRRGWLKIAFATFDSMPGNPQALSAQPVSGFFLWSVSET